MTFWGVGENGERFLLGDPMEASLSYDRDAPADLLRVLFPADKLWDRLREVALLENGQTVFRGLVDEQNTRLSSKGITVELVCRSMEALLLDNEALPGVINSPSLEVLEERLLKPLGLSLGEGDRSAKRGALTISKGDSCWTALEAYCERFLGTSPWVDAQGQVQCAGKQAETLRLSQVTEAVVELSPCKRISEVWQQSFRGSYDTRFRNSAPGPMRRRYVSRESGKDPRAVLVQGERDAFLLTVTCAGAQWPGRRASATVDVPGLGLFESCPVRGALYRRDSRGEQTRLCLEQSEKEDVPCG